MSDTIAALKTWKSKTGLQDHNPDRVNYRARKNRWINPTAIETSLFNILKYIAHELENSQAATNFADSIERSYADLELIVRHSHNARKPPSFEDGFFSF